MGNMENILLFNGSMIDDDPGVGGGGRRGRGLRRATLIQ